MNVWLRLCRVLSLLFTLLAAASCTGQYAHLQGRYDVNTAEYEAELAQGNNLDRQDYYLLCDAYSNTKNYAKICDCADQFVKSAQQTDRLQELWTNPFANSMGEGWQNPASLADFWRTQAQDELHRSLALQPSAQALSELAAMHASLGDVALAGKLQEFLKFMVGIGGQG